MTRPGFTLHELLISMSVLSGVMAVAAHVSLHQLRFYRAAAEVVATRNQVGQSAEIIASSVRGISPGAGDVTAALDSAIEFYLPIGSAVVCATQLGRISIVAPVASSGNTLSAFTEPPEAGDRISVLFEDSTGVVWLNFSAASAAAKGGQCGAPLPQSPSWALSIRESVEVPAGAVARFSRPFRLSHYRAGDGKWYLGARDWNGASSAFNIIQPVAGPLKPFSKQEGVSGLALVYRGAAGQVLDPPFQTSRIAGMTIVVRGLHAPPGDSVIVTVAFPNAPPSP